MKKIIISGEIGWDVTPDKVRGQITEAKGGNIDVQLSSPGGFVFDGLEIYNMFSEYRRENPKAQIMLTLKGLAASMASYIASNLAFDIVKAEDNAVFMMHNPYAMAIGDYRDMKKSWDILSGISRLLATSYGRRSNKDAMNMQELMDEETWYFGDEIKDAGFVDEMIKTGEETEKTAACAKAKIRFQDLLNRMKKAERAKDDVVKIAAMLNTTIPEQDELQSIKEEDSTIKSESSVSDDGDYNNPATGGKITQEETMDLKQIQTEHSDLYAEILAAGAESERNRIQGIKSLFISGHEVLIDEMIVDGKTTPEQAAIRIVAAEKAKQKGALDALKTDKKDVHADPVTKVPETSGVDPNAPVEGRAKAEWDKSAEIRDEFKEFAMFLAYKKNYESGNAKIIKGGEK